jgi:methyl-accepting chemotaxis protein
MLDRHNVRRLADTLDEFNNRLGAAANSLCATLPSPLAEDFERLIRNTMQTVSRARFRTNELLGLLEARDVSELDLSRSFTAAATALDAVASEMKQMATACRLARAELHATQAGRASSLVDALGRGVGDFEKKAHQAVGALRASSRSR